MYKIYKMYKNIFLLDISSEFFYFYFNYVVNNLIHSLKNSYLEK